MGSTDTAGNEKALKNANAAYNMYNRDYNQWRDQYNQYRQQADKMFSKDYGTGAADYMNKASTAGVQQANQTVGAGARAATNQAQLASRTAGLSKGQAAMNAAGTAGNFYGQNWGNAVQQGQQNYGNAVNMGQQQKQGQMSSSANLMGQAGQGMQGAMNTQAGVGSNQTSQWDRNMGIVSGIGGLVSGFGSIMGSDERMKENIKPKNGWYDDFMSRLSALEG